MTRFEERGRDVVDISIIIRTLNEARYLGELLEGIQNQETDGLTVETVLIDSGSTDQTLDIAKRYGCVVRQISKRDFSFGRSLNMGCETATGNLFVIVSGHCVPASSRWLIELVSPLRSGQADYSYGRQLGRDTTKYSEERVFQRFFPEEGVVKDSFDFFCNNANSAITRRCWAMYRFDEELTGLEDLELAKRYVNDGGKVAYCADSPVYHIHNESWKQVKVRYEREAIALQKICPEIQFSRVDMLSYALLSIIHDFKAAAREKKFFEHVVSICAFRFFQYWGTYVGNNDHRMMSARLKQRYFYPDHREVRQLSENDSRTVANEGAQ